MRCPYLKQAEVKSCREAGFRALIPATGEREACSCAAHRTCAVFLEHAPAAETAARCPFLDTAPMRYCAAAPVRKFVPAGETGSRCTDAGFRYCATFLERMKPAAPVRLFHSANHMWLDMDSEGMCHLGIDALFAGALETVEQIHFLTTAGWARPAAVLRARGVDVPVVFPNPLVVTACNLYLRANPARLVADPFRLGWLFEGRERPENPVRAGLASGSEGTAWMRQEAARMKRRPYPAGREDLLSFFHEFFSPWGTSAADLGSQP